MRWPLRNQIVMPFAVLTVCCVASVSTISSYMEARRARQEVESLMSDIGETIERGAYPLNDAVLRQLRHLSGAHIVLSDPDGDVIATTLEGDHMSAWNTAGAISAHDETIALREERYLHKAFILPARGGRVPGQELHVLYPERRWLQDRWEATWPPLVVGAATLAAVIIVAAFIARGMRNPLGKLRHHMDRLRSGDYQPTPLPRRDDELRDLLSAGNDLASRLDELTRTIQRTERLALLGQLSGGLAHQLRNHVTGALLAVQLHERDDCGGDAESLAVVRRQLELMECGLRRLLAIGQPGQSHSTSFNLTEVIEQVVRLVEPTCRHRRIRLTFDGRHPVTMMGDAEQIMTLVSNLTINAIEAAGTDGWVRLSLEGDEPDRVVLRVEDSGAGPSPNVVARLFEPFVTDKPEGVGLGLAVARRIARSHGGDITLAASSPTCFAAFLQVNRAAPPRGDDRIDARRQAAVAVD